jgi:hypothetical protein
LGPGLGVMVGDGLLLGRGGRPLAKPAIRGWLSDRTGACNLGARALSLTAEVRENISDLSVEATSEATGPLARAPGAGGPSRR